MSLDLFGHVYSTLEAVIQRESPEAFARRFSNYKTSRDLSSICESLLNITVSPSTAWQIAEVGHYVFSQSSAATENLRLINSRLQKLRGQKADKRVISSLKNEKKAFEGIRDTKPVWGIKGQIPKPFGNQIADDENTRSQEVAGFPPICFRMRLSVPMLSPVLIKGDRPFVGHENPFCTEKVTGLPLLRPSSLKGQLRHAAMAAGATPERIDKLFGPKDIEETGALKSRAMFLPVYVPCKIEHDIIAPHDATKCRIGVTGPVTLEVIRPNELIIWLQYWPYDLLSRYASQNYDGLSNELFSDYQLLIKGLSYWMENAGIGAKTSSGYGQADWPNVESKIIAPAKSPWNGLNIRMNLKGILQSLDKDKLESEWHRACVGRFENKVAEEEKHD
jgi:CRISPR/Cas system CMR subunit Cmr6 (Cas7 group RAMP superfamily)